MHRIDTPTAAAALPAPTAQGTAGYFTKGNPVGGVPATVPGQDWHNMIQEELVAAVQAGGETLDVTKFDFAQLARSIKRQLQWAAPISAVAGGTADALTASVDPTFSQRTDGMELRVRAVSANATTTPTLAASLTPAATIKTMAGVPLWKGAIAGAGHELLLKWNDTGGYWALLNPMPHRLRGHISGFVVNNNATTPTTHIDISAGQATDSTTAEYINGAAMTKNLSLVWAPNSGAGGFYIAGGLPVSSNIYIFAIKKVLDGSVDYYGDISPTAANIPAGYTAYRRVGWVYTDGTGSIKGFVPTESAGGDVRVRWTIAATNISATSSTSELTATLTAPPGALADIRASMYRSLADDTLLYVYETWQAKANMAPLVRLGSNNGQSVDSIRIELMTNESSQIKWSADFAGQPVIISTFGYIDRRVD